jgi:hypothetical protein
MVIKREKISDIEPNPFIRHASLPNELIERIKKFKGLLGDVENATLEETIDSFKRDMNPEREIRIWERIASVYNAYISEKSITDLATRKEVFSVILRLSMGMRLEDFKDIKILNKEQLEDIIYNYNPLTLKDIINKQNSR